MTPRSRRRLLPLAAGISTLALLGSLAPGAHAEQPADGMERALADHAGISVAEARTQLVTEARLSELDGDVAAALTDSQQAGSWIEAEELMVAVTSEAAAEQVEAAGATPRLVELSQAELDTVQAELDALAGSGAGVLSWGVDAQANAVTVEVNQAELDAAGRDFVVAAEALGATVVDTEATASTSAQVFGGQEYSIDNRGLCSVGFNARGPQGPVVITAGHCTEGASSFQFRGSSLGTPGVTSFPGDDFATINLARQHTGVAAVDRYDGTAVAVQGSNESAVGASLCKSGRTTGWTCGQVTGKNRTVNYGNGDVVSGLTSYSACVEQGDSGGSNLTGNQAQGVTSGASLFQSGGRLVCGEKVGQRSNSFFQPLNEVLSTQRLTLLTS